MATRSIVPLNHNEGSLGKAGRAWGSAYINTVNADEVKTRVLTGTDGSKYVTEEGLDKLIDTVVTQGLGDTESDISKALENTFLTNEGMRNVLINAINSSEAITNLNKVYVSLNKVASKGNKTTPIYFDENGVAQPVEGVAFANGSGSGNSSLEGPFENSTILIGSKEDTQGFSFEVPWISINNQGAVIEYGIRTHTIPNYWDYLDNDSENMMPAEGSNHTIKTSEEVHTVSSSLIGSKTNTEGFKIEIPWLEVNSAGLIVDKGFHIHTIPQYWTTDTDDETNNSISPFSGEEE